MTVDHDRLPLAAQYRSAFVIMLGITIVSLDLSVMNLALPAMARSLDSSAADTVWVLNAFQLGALVLLLPAAALGDLIGHRRVYLAGVLVLMVASAICFFAPSLPLLAGARGLQGMGAAGIMASNGALVRLTYPGHLFGRGLALNAATVATATVAGPLFAAVVLSLASWPWLFALNVPVCALILLMGWQALPRKTTPRVQGRRLAWFDVILNALMFGLIFLGVHEFARTRAEPDVLGTALALLAAGLVIGFFYLRRQLVAPVPLFPIVLLRIPIFSLSICTSIASFASQTLSFIALPFLILEVWKYSAYDAGLIITMWPLAMVFIAPVAGRLIGRYPSGLLGGIGMAIMAIGTALLAMLPDSPAFADIAWRMALCGIGFGLFQSPNNHTLLTSAPRHLLGAAGGMLATARLTGQSVGAILMVLIFSFGGGASGGAPLIALGFAAGFAAVAAILSLLRLRHDVPAD